MSIAGALVRRSPIEGRFLAVSLEAMRMQHESPLRIAEAAPTAFGTVDESILSAPDNLLVAFDGVLWVDPFAPALPVAPADCGQKIVAAYRAWGDRFAGRLNGDFAFALWDSAQGKLLLGRDAMGRRPLHYLQTGEGLLWASEPRGLTCHAGWRFQLDREHVVHWLAARLTPESTFFAGIRRIPAGHLLIATQSGEHLLRYWNPLFVPELRVRDDREYTEALHAALKRAVSVRARVSSRIAAHLSGGLDSTSVCALLAGEAPFTAFTAVPSRPVAAGEHASINRLGDESANAAAVANMYPNVNHVLVPNGSISILEAMDMRSDAEQSPTWTIRNVSWLCAIEREAAAMGAQLLFSGTLGNSTLSYNGEWGLLDLLHRRRYASLLHAARARRRAGQSFASILWSTFMVGRPVRHWIQRARGHRVPGLFSSVAMNPDAFRRSGLPRAVQTWDYSVLGRRPASGAEGRLAQLMAHDPGMQLAASRRLFGVHVVDPFADRNLVELCLSIPDEAYRLRGVPRERMREVMRNHLPAQVLQDRRRGLQGADFHARFAAELPAMHEEMRQLRQCDTAREFLDLETMQSLLDRWPAAGFGGDIAADLDYSSRFGRALSLGRFLRRFNS